MALDLNLTFRRALDLMENTCSNLFITGRAGTGKSTLLSHFRTNTKKNVALLAPTGIAALNVKGQTIHSFFKFRPSVTLAQVRRLKEDKDRDLYRNLDLIVIDEISMVRADLMDCMDRFLRLNGKNAEMPFGGVQMVFIGDLYQLPPVVATVEKEAFSENYPSPYFFSGKFFETFSMEYLELDKIYRQKDSTFINLLDAIRNQSFNQNDITNLNKRLKEDFIQPERDCYVYLTPYTLNAREINMEQLDKLKGKLHEFDAVITGDFAKDCYPTSKALSLKAHSQIMMINNDFRGRWVNGTMGKVLAIEERDDKKVIVVQLDNHKKVSIKPFEWEITQFVLEDGHMKSKTVGTFTQYPIALAWALTIHKSQGKTFEKVVFDIGRGAFTPGQVYVALSRCTSLEGLILKKPIQRQHMWVNPEIVNFLSDLDAKCPIRSKIKHIEKAIKSHKSLVMSYRRADDQCVTITIIPLRIDTMRYQVEEYLGIEGILHSAQGNTKRLFRIDRIIDLVV